MNAGQSIWFCAIISLMLKYYHSFNGLNTDNNDRPPHDGRDLFI
jgi:hypothetical protein